MLQNQSEPIIWGEAGGPGGRKKCIDGVGKEIVNFLSTNGLAYA